MCLGSKTASITGPSAVITKWMTVNFVQCTECSLENKNQNKRENTSCTRSSLEHCLSWALGSMGPPSKWRSRESPGEVRVESSAVARGTVWLSKFPPRTRNPRSGAGGGGQSREVQMAGKNPTGHPQDGASGAPGDPQKGGVLRPHLKIERRRGAAGCLQWPRMARGG